METFEKIRDLQAFLKSQKARDRQIGFVPTLGALHAGHGALIEKACAQNAVTVVSRFINPTQFDDPADFKAYPRDPEGDARFCQQYGVTTLFQPSAQELYPEPFQTRVALPQLTQTLCGAKRPGHFEGVATVVSKLLHIIQPRRAYFGEKDAQQLAVVKRMVKDLNFPVEIIGVPTVRDADGLAISSRNARLNPQQRLAALVLNRALHEAQKKLKSGRVSLTWVKSHLIEQIQSERLATIDYVSIVDAETLRETTTPKGTVLVAAAAYFGEVRLIDNFSHTFAKRNLRQLS